MLRVLHDHITGHFQTINTEQNKKLRCRNVHVIEMCNVFVIERWMCLLLKGGMCLLLTCGMCFLLKDGMCLLLNGEMCLLLKGGMCLLFKCVICQLLKCGMCFYWKVVCVCYWNVACVFYWKVACVCYWNVECVCYRKVACVCYWNVFVIERWTATGGGLFASVGQLDCQRHRGVPGKWSLHTQLAIAKRQQLTQKTDDFQIITINAEKYQNIKINTQNWPKKTTINNQNCKRKIRIQTNEEQWFPSPFFPFF